MSSGPSELIMLSAGLIVAALVSGVLLTTWDDMSEILDDRGKQDAEDVRTRVSLVSDPLNINWESSDYVHVHLQNSGDTFLDVDSVGVVISGVFMSVEAVNGETEWIPGQVVKFKISDDASDTLNGILVSGGNDVQFSATVSSTTSSYTGTDITREVIRIVKP